MRAIEFYFDFLSPYSYLAHSQLGTLDVPVRLIPISVLDVMKIVNNTPTTLICGAKRSYAGKDLARWAARYGLPMGRPDMRRVDGELLLRLATAAERKDIAGDVTTAIFNAVWGGVGDASPKGISAALSEKRLPAAELMSLAERKRRTSIDSSQR
jgi:2-hydroxychromene-2-carboxylate isomerase